MKCMTAKQYLRQIRTLNRRIDSLIAEKDRLTAIAEGVSGMSYDDVKVQSARVTPGNRQTDAVCKLIDIEERITYEIDRYVDMREDAERYISQLKSPVERDLLRNYYLTGLTWEQVAELMLYDNRTMYKIHGRTLFHLEHLVDLSHL